MPLHLVKLCVGAENIADLEEWVADRTADGGEHIHRTRMMPRRGEEILAGGSLFWVIKGVLNCRQQIAELRGVTAADGLSYCDIVLDPRIVRVDPRPRGPFQGWRYLPGPEAPPDLDIAAADGAELPLELSSELRRIGLI